MTSNGSHPPPAPAVAEEEKPLPGRKIVPLESLRRHWLAAGAVAFSVLVVGLIVAFIRGQPVYSATGVVHVNPRFMKNLDEDLELQFQSNSQYRQYVEQQRRTINRYDILETALNQLKEEGIVWQTEAESWQRAVQRLQKELKTRPVPDTYLITISLEDDTPDHLAPIINTVAEVYEEVSRVEEFYDAEDRINDLKAEVAEVQAEIDAAIRRRTEIALEIGTTTFNEYTLNPYDNLLIGAKEALAKARRERIEAEAALAAYDGAQRADGDDALEALAWESVANDPALNSLKANLSKRRGDLLTAQSGLKPEHPGYQAVEREQDSIADEIRQENRRLLAEVRGRKLDLLQAEVFETVKLENELQQEVDAEAQRAQRFSEGYHEAIVLGHAIERLRGRQTRLYSRIDFLELESQAPGFVRIVTPARTPELPISGGKRQIFMLFVVAAFGMALATPVAIDFLDGRVRCLADVHRSMGFPAMAWLPDTEGDLAPWRGEQLRRLAGKLIHDRERSKARVMLLAGANNAADVGSLIAALAAEIRQQDSPCAVVVADTWAEPDGRRGLVDVLEGRWDARQATADAATLPLGEWPEGRPLPFVRRLPQVLESLADTHGLVLVQAAPLDVADTELLVGMADATLLVVSQDKITIAEVKERAERLERLDPPAVGCILVDARQQFGEPLSGQRERPAPAQAPAEVPA